MLSVSSVFYPVAAELSIESDASDPIDVSVNAGEVPARLVCQPQPKEFGNLDEKFAHGAQILTVCSTVNGQGTGVAAADVEHMHVQGGPGDNQIDVSGVTSVDFPNLVDLDANGGSGDDSIVGSSFDDLLFGGAGDDVISGEGGNDEIHGDAGDDVVRGGAGDDNIFGEDGNDHLFGEAGNDRIDARHDAVGNGTGDDIGVVNSGTWRRDVNGNDAWDGLDAAQVLSTGNGAGTTVIAGDWNGDTAVQAVDVVEGGAGDDVLIGGQDHNEIHGGDGNDSLVGGASDDVLHGDAGDDSLHGGIGNDDLFGESGNDQLFGEEGDDSLSGGANDDDLWGDDGNVTLHGDSGNDSLHGGPGNDDLFGEDGNDDLFDDDGNDSLDDGEDD